MSDRTHIAEIVERVLESPWPAPYAPARWESPIEEAMWDALRCVGMTVATQAPVGRFRADLLVSSRLSGFRLAVECDGRDYHHSLMDDFRDDLFEDLGQPVVRLAGYRISQSPDRCAVAVVKRWFPEHVDTLGYGEAWARVKAEMGEIPDLFLPSFRPDPEQKSGAAHEDRLRRDRVRAAFRVMPGEPPVSLVDYARAYIAAYSVQPEGTLADFERWLGERRRG